MSEVIQIASSQEGQGPEGVMKNETITLIIPEEMASGDGIQVVTLPPGIADLSNVRVQVGDSNFEQSSVTDEQNTCHIVHEVVESSADVDVSVHADVSVSQEGAEDMEVEPASVAVTKQKRKNNKISIAVQANDYDIERRSGRTPARMRVIPAKFRDYKNPDYIKEEPESDEDYEPSDEWEIKPRGRGRGRRPNNNLMKRPPPKKRGKPGRPRKYPKLESVFLEQPAAQPDETSSPAPEVSLDPTGIAVVFSDSTPAIQAEAATSVVSDGPVPQGDTQAKDQVTAAGPGEKSNPFQCKTCGKTFTLKGNLKTHEFIHLGLKPYKCDMTGCERVFRTAEACRRHKFSHLGVKLFECELCKTKFSTNQALKEHMSRHTDSRPHVCKYCQKTFRQLSCLSRHMTIHSHEKPYQCDICNKQFSQMAYLKSHKRSHTGERPFKCNHPGCEKAFAHQSDLIRHKIIHSGKKPYACGICTARFNDASSRRRHLKEHTGTKPYACQLCDESFRRAGQLKVHLSKQHMGVISVDASSRPVVKIPADTGGSTLRLLLREDGKFESVSEQVIKDGQVVTLETGKNPSDDAQLEHVQSQLQQVLTQLRQQRNQFPQDSGEVDVHVVTLGPDGQVQESVNRIISQTFQSIEGAAGQVASVQEVTEQELAVQIALDEMGVVEDGIISETNTKPVEDHDNIGQSNLQNIVNVSDITSCPLSPSVLSTAQIMQDIRNTPVHHTLSSAPQQQMQSTVDNVVNDHVRNGQESQSGECIIPSDQPVTEQVIDNVLVMNPDGEQKTQNNEKLETVLHYEIVGEVPDGEPHVLEIQYMDESGNPNGTQPVYQYANDLAINGSNQPVQLQKAEVQYVENAAEQTTASKAVEVQDAITENKLPNPAPTSSMMDFVINPDFSSQDYYNWLSSFVELCKVVPMPLDMDLFQKVSQVHKTLSDVLANPSGVLSNRNNFTTLMSISRDLGGIVNEHLTFVLQNLEKAAVQT